MIIKVRVGLYLWTSSDIETDLIALWAQRSIDTAVASLTSSPTGKLPMIRSTLVTGTAKNIGVARALPALPIADPTVVVQVTDA